MKAAHRCPHCGAPTGPDGAWDSFFSEVRSRGGQSKSPKLQAARHRNAAKARARFIALRKKRNAWGTRRIRRRSYTAAGLAS